jgi:hypothetical protein
VYVCMLTVQLVGNKCDLAHLLNGKCIISKVMLCITLITFSFSINILSIKVHHMSCKLCGLEDKSNMYTTTIFTGKDYGNVSIWRDGLCWNPRLLISKELLPLFIVSVC